jgi:UDP-N-acetyl-D-glucosamine dehydrogenase
VRTGSLRSKIADHSLSVGVIGQGYVGLSVGMGAAVAGMTVQALDLDEARIDALQAGRNVVAGVADSTLALAMETGNLHFGTDPAVLGECDVVLICVPTPVTEHRPDVTAIESAGRMIGPLLRRESLVILESTTYPGTTEQVLLPLLEVDGRRAGRDFLVAYSPERIDPGNEKYGLRNTPRIVGGHTAAATELAALFYAQLVDEVMPLSSCRAAELAKLLENTFRMVNIALVNELAQLCAEQGIDTWEVIRAAGTKPFGFMSFYPGPGVGGHCIPLDPTYLAWQSRRDTGRPFRLVEMAQDINSQMPAYVTRRIAETLNDRGISVKGARIFALGVTYKPNVGDIRESAALETLELLRRRGARISYHDPFVAQVDQPGLRMRSKAVTRQTLRTADCVLLLTPHDTFDLDLIVSESRLLFDARNATNVRLRPSVVTL